MDLTGKRFGRLVVVDQADYRLYGGRRFAYWNCVCDCGERVTVLAKNLRCGITKSCRCFQIDRIKEANTDHGLSKLPEYQAWADARRRCYDEKNFSYGNYGGRGIKMCDRWLYSFENFYADMGPRPNGLTLERKNNNGNYEPSNCKWATHSDQQRNKRKKTRNARRIAA